MDELSLGELSSNRCGQLQYYPYTTLFTTREQVVGRTKLFCTLHKELWKLPITWPRSSNGLQVGIFHRNYVGKLLTVAIKMFYESLRGTAELEFSLSEKRKNENV